MNSDSLHTILTFLLATIAIENLQLKSILEKLPSYLSCVQRKRVVIENFV